MSVFSLRISVPGILVVCALMAIAWTYRSTRAEIVVRTEAAVAQTLKNLMDHHQRFIENEIRQDDWCRVIEEVSDLGADPYILDAVLVGADDTIVSSTRLGDIGKNAEEVVSRRWPNDYSPIQSYLRSPKPSMRFTGVSQKTGNALYVYPVNFGSDQFTLRPERRGALIVRYDLGRRIADATSTASRQALIQGGFFLLLMGGLAFYLDLVVVRRISRLISSSEAASEGDYSVRAPSSGRDELARLGQMFNKMLDQRSSAEKSLRESERRYRAVVEDQTELICRYLPDTGITFVNEAYCRYFDTSLDEIIGHRFMPAIHEEDRSEFQEHLAALGSENPVAIHEHRVIMRDGEERWQRWTNRAIVDDAGKVIEIQGTGRDVTEHKQDEERIARFGLIFEESLNEIYLFDSATLKFIQLNRAAQQNLGYTMEELLELTPLDLKPRFSADSFGQLIASLRSGEREKIVFETVHRRKDQSLYDVEIHLQLLKQDHKAIFAAIVTDITRQKKAQAREEEFDARSSAVIENAADGIITIDEVGTIESVNPSAATLFGYARSELIGQNVKMLMHEPYRGEHDGHLERYRTSGVKNVIGSVREVPGRRKDGTHFPLKLTISEVIFGEQRLFTGIVHDLTHERELERQLLQAQKMESLGTLAGGIAHDFNNILQAILGFNGIAQENVIGNNEILAECLQEIEAGGRRASDLVNQILTFSHISEVEIGPTALQPIIKEALRFLRSSMPATIRIESNIDADCGQIAANATQMHQVVTNLCTNSMHAMEERGGVLTVSVEPVSIDSSLETLSGPLEPGEYVQLSVTDTGAGIEPDLFRRLLDPFFTTKEVGKGTGLGLAMVHGIVKSMQGGLTIESEVGKGTTVCVVLPVLGADHGLEAPKKSIESAGSGTGHVLVVDDEKTITKLTTLLLKSRGFTVEAFNDVDSAWRAIQANPEKYDVAILDYTMPGKTGLELAQDLYSLTPNMPIVLATGLLDKSKIDKAKSPNVVAIIKKPFDVDELVAAINQSLQTQTPL